MSPWSTAASPTECAPTSIGWKPRDLEVPQAAKLLKGMQGILVPGGFGHRGIEGKIEAIRYARERKVPYFGMCLGMQTMAIEFARHVLKLKGANSTEFDTETPYPIISMLEEQRSIKSMGGTMRLGAYPCRVAKGSKASLAYGEVIFERHRHRYEFNNEFKEAFSQEPVCILQRRLARRQPGGDDGDQEPPLDAGRAVPPRIQKPPHRRPPAVPRVHQGVPAAQGLAGAPPWQKPRNRGPAKNRRPSSRTKNRKRISPWRS